MTIKFENNPVTDGPCNTVVPNDIEDRIGHGSHVAGSIAGNGYILGVAPNIGFRSYRIFGADGRASTDVVIKAIVAAVRDKVDVISMSLGGYDIKGQAFYTDPKTGVKTNLGNNIADLRAYKRAIKYAIEHDITVVASAGNEALNCSQKSDVTAYLNSVIGVDGLTFVGAGFEIPGSISGVITASATGPDKSLASYSNYGTGFIDLTAPGGDFQRFGVDDDWYTDMCLSSFANGGYSWMAGTSMATPKVAAVAALIIEKYGKIGPEKVSAILSNTATDIGKNGKDAYSGKGMVNAYNAQK